MLSTELEQMEAEIKALLFTSFPRLVEGHGNHSVLGNGATSIWAPSTLSTGHLSQCKPLRLTPATLLITPDTKEGLSTIKVESDVFHYIEMLSTELEQMEAEIKALLFTSFPRLVEGHGNHSVLGNGATSIWAPSTLSTGHLSQCKPLRLTPATLLITPDTKEGGVWECQCPRRRP
ncbi:hypothetical protein SRHO_G00103730 [Serrasalmus rhombeus]